MVNTGRPSEGCHACRKRKKRCDQRRPQCGPCTRLGQKCPGYRDTTSMLFVNETSKTKSRVLRDRNHTLSQFWITQNQILSNPHQDSRNVGIGFFQSHLADALHFTFCRDLEMSEETQPLAEAAAIAAGLSGCAAVHKSEIYSREAYQNYGKALVLAKDYLEKPTARKSHIIAAIIVLGGYEALNHHSLFVAIQNTIHPSGICAFLSTCKPEDFSEPSDIEILSRFKTMVACHCLVYDFEIPRKVKELLDSCLGSEPNPLERLMNIAIAIGEERTKLGKCEGDGNDVVAFCRHWDAELSRWAADVRGIPFLAYDEIPHGVDIGDGIHITAHSYSAQEAVTIWQFYRSIRILLSVLLNLQLARLAVPLSSPQQFDVARLRAQLVDAHLAAAAFRLGHRCHEKEGTQDHIDNVGVAYNLAWSLFFVGEVLCDTPQLAFFPESDPKGRYGQKAMRAQLRWTIQKLNYVAEVAGVYQSDRFARILRDKFETHCELEDANYTTLTNHNTIIATALTNQQKAAQCVVLMFHQMLASWRYGPVKLTARELTNAFRYPDTAFRNDR